MGKKYIVKSQNLVLGQPRKNVAHRGDVLDEGEFKEGQIKRFLGNGGIEEVKREEKVEEENKTEETGKGKFGRKR